MIDFKIVDKKVKKSLNEILFPKEKIRESEFIDAIEVSDFIWYEHSQSGISFSKFSVLPYKKSALLKDDNSEEYVKISSPYAGSISVTFDPKVQYEDLIKVYEFAKVNNWNLWLITPLTLIDDAYMEAFR